VAAQPGNVSPVVIETDTQIRAQNLSWVTKVIGDIGAEAGEAIPELTELGFHTNPMVRYLAAESLRKIGS